MCRTKEHAVLQLLETKSTTSGQAHEVFKGNYFNHFEASLGELNPWDLLPILPKDKKLSKLQYL